MIRDPSLPLAGERLLDLHDGHAEWDVIDELEEQLVGDELGRNVA